MDKLKEFGYVANNIRHYEGDINNRYIYHNDLYFYKEKEQNVIFFRKNEYISSYDDNNISYGILVNEEEIIISNELGDKIFRDVDLLICFMESINKKNDKEIEEFISVLDSSKEKGKTLKKKL